MIFRGYKIVGLYAQYDVWDLDKDGRPEELYEELDRGMDFHSVEVWTYEPEDDYYTLNGDFDTESFNSVGEAKKAINEFLKNGKA